MMKKLITEMLKINADTLTPVGIFKKLNGTKKFLLESSFQHETKGNYSYVGANPYMEVIGRDTQSIVKDVNTGNTTIYKMPVLEYFKAHFPKQDAALPLPFYGGAIGYTAYDAIRQYADIGNMPPDEIDTPDHHYLLYQTIIAYEHRSETAYLITNNVNGESKQEMQAVLKELHYELNKDIHIDSPEDYPVHFTSQMDKQTFMKRVEKAKAYIQSNEATQIVLSQRLTADLNGDPFSFYRSLRSANPSPYMFYIDFTDYLIIGASPESLVQTNGNQVITNPIAGTRPRGNSADEDTALKEELLQDKKELNEHHMLVDLSKKDFSAICKAESITTPVYMEVLAYQHVMHIVSEVHGELKEGKSSFDALIASLPAGTVSGAPKTRAMQIINELETVKRGFYAGGIGYISFNHDINLAIAIRSILVKDHKAYLQVGAGIVADSVPEKEYEETLHKARSLTELQNHLERI